MKRPGLSAGWVLAHVLIGALAATFVGLGFWQLDRHGEKRAFNAQLVARAEQPRLDLTGLGDIGDPEALAFRRARARGTYDVEREVVLLSRAHRGLSGHHVVTPLVLEDGRAVLVDRGWVPLELDEPPVEPARPPADVVVEGSLAPSQQRGRFGPQTADGDGPARRVFRIDVERLREDFPYQILPVFLQLEGQAPEQAGEYPIPVPLPGPATGPHLSYAIQWFLFATIALVGHGANTRRVVRAARRRESITP